MVSSQIHCSQMKGLKSVYQSWVSFPCSISHSLNHRKTIPQRDFDQADTSTGPVPAFGIPKLALANADDICKAHSVQANKHQQNLMPVYVVLLGLNIQQQPDWHVKESLGS